MDHYDDNYQSTDAPEGSGALTTILSSAEGAIERLLTPLVTLVQQLEAKTQALQTEVQTLRQRIDLVEATVRTADRELSNIQGRVSEYAAADLTNMRRFPCPVCGAPNEFSPMPGESDEAAKNRVCCHRCGIHTGNQTLVDRAKKTYGK